MLELLFRKRLRFIPKPNIYLIGPSGVGKSTLGPMLSQALSLPFFDMNQLLVETVGLKTNDVCKTLGVLKLNSIEREIIRKLLGKQFILSTGAGTAHSLLILSIMLRTGIIIWLDMSAITGLERILKREEKRRNPSPQKHFLELYGSFSNYRVMRWNSDFYYSHADFHVLTDKRTESETLAEILEKIAILNPSSKRRKKMPNALKALVQ